MSIQSSSGVARRLIGLMRAENLQVGDRLPSIRALSEMLGVGPNVVRDAVVQVQTRGLLRIEPRSGVFVQSLDFSSFVDAFADTLDTSLAQKDPNLVHLLEARSLIEEETIGIAAARRRPEDLMLLRDPIEALHKAGTDMQRRAEADEEFHLRIAIIAGNSVLVVMLRALLVLLRPYRMSQQLTAPQRKLTLDQHEQIYRALSERDAPLAQQLMRRHVLSYLENL
jgi:DNA-binding FadR family transcriptional regulator